MSKPQLLALYWVNPPLKEIIFCLEGFWGQPQGQKFPSLWATIFVLRLDCSTVVALIIPQMMLYIWKLADCGARTGIILILTWPWCRFPHCPFLLNHTMYHCKWTNILFCLSSPSFYQRNWNPTFPISSHLRWHQVPTVCCHQNFHQVYGKHNICCQKNAANLRRVPKS